VLHQYGPGLYVADVAASGAAPAAPAAAVAAPAAAPATSSVVPKSLPKSAGSLPYTENTWLLGWNSPYYKDSHRRLQAAMQEWVEREMMPYCHEWEEQYALPPGLPAKAYAAGWFPGVVGGSWPTEYVGSHIMGGVKPEEFDAFHEKIILEELARCGSAGVGWGMCAGLNIGLPPVLHFAPKALCDRVAGPCLRGEKVICLAITEPSAGSDVANLRTTAVKTPDGKHYIVNGEKKWITNGVFADFFTTAVRTGGDGMGGISLLLLERTMPGITTRQMKCSGAWCSGTTYITFEDVKVPVENLIGTENEGFKVRRRRHHLHPDCDGVYSLLNRSLCGWRGCSVSCTTLTTSAGPSVCMRHALLACATRRPSSTRSSARPLASC